MSVLQCHGFYGKPLQFQVQIQLDTALAPLALLPRTNNDVDDDHGDGNYDCMVENS